MENALAYNSPRRSLLFVNQFYYPDVASTGQHLTDLAEYLAARGHDVSILCGRGHYLSGVLQAPRQEVHNGVKIYRVGTTGFGRASHVGRLIDYASFYGNVALRILFGKRYDYVITLTTPPLLSLAGAVLRAVKRQRYGIWSMDLHPDAEEAVGLLRGDQILTRTLHALNNVGYRHADFVVDLGPYMNARIIEKGVAPERVCTIAVWSKKEEICPVPRQDNPLLKQLALQDKFVVMYSGNAGLAHRFDEVLSAMDILKEHPDFYFLFVGSGPRKEEIISFAREHDIRNFQYLTYFPREQLRYSLSLGDVHLLTLRNDMAGIVVPSKLYGTMAAGRPIVMVGPDASEPAQTILQEGIGVVIDPNGRDASSTFHLADVLLDLYAQAELREQMGQRARDVFLEKYEQDVLCQAWAWLIESMHGTCAKPVAALPNANATPKHSNYLTMPEA